MKKIILMSIVGFPFMLFFLYHTFFIIEKISGASFSGEEGSGIILLEQPLILFLSIIPGMRILFNDFHNPIISSLVLALANLSILIVLFIRIDRGQWSKRKDQRLINEKVER